MADFAVILIITTLMFIAILHIIRTKKHGVKCAGCSARETCSLKKNGKAMYTCGCVNTLNNEDKAE